MNVDDILGLMDRSSVGKGRKECPNCNEIIGARTRTCGCGYSFKENTVIHKKKQGKCSVCGKSFYNKCDCEKPAVNKSEERLFAERMGYPAHSVLIVPSGKCPFKFKMGDDLDKWMKSVFFSRMSDGIICGKDAMKQYMRQFYDYNSNEYKELRRRIDETNEAVFYS